MFIVKIMTSHKQVTDFRSMNKTKESELINKYKRVQRWIIKQKTIKNKHNKTNGCSNRPNNNSESIKIR
jgi:hypothetical protein